MSLLSLRRSYFGRMVYSVVFIGTVLVLVSTHFMFQYINMSSLCSTIIIKDQIAQTPCHLRMLENRSIYNASTPHLLDFPTKAITEELANDLDKVFFNNVATYVDNMSQSMIPILETVNREYLLENPELCSSVANLSVLIIVHTATDHYTRRNDMRRTWMNETYFQGLAHFKVLFLLGRVNNFETQHSIENEFSQYKDMLQGDFVDSYRNLTLKGVMAYKWISERCTNAKIILKVDDDVMIDMFLQLTEILPSLQNKTKHIMCNVFLLETMPIRRAKSSKWYVSEEFFRGQKYYSMYCRGFTVIITNDVIPAIFRSTLVTPFFWVEDVYLYGLAPGRVLGIKYESFKKGSYDVSVKKAITCYQNKTTTCDFLVVGVAARIDVDMVWNYIRHNYTKKM